MKKEYFVPDMTGVDQGIPAGYEHCVRPFEAVVFDGEVPIGWGFRCNGRTMTTERWEAFPDSDRVCVGMKDAPAGARIVGEWVYVRRWLVPAEAVKVYGPVSGLDVGPRGGFRSVRYGVTVFKNRSMDPRGVVPVEILGRHQRVMSRTFHRRIEYV